MFWNGQLKLTGSPAKSLAIKRRVFFPPCRGSRNKIASDDFITINRICLLSCRETLNRNKRESLIVAIRGLDGSRSFEITFHERLKGPVRLFHSIWNFVPTHHEFPFVFFTTLYSDRAGPIYNLERRVAVPSYVVIVNKWPGGYSHCPGDQSVSYGPRPIMYEILIVFSPIQP